MTKKWNKEIQRGFRPRFCVWELTLACNLNCGHCGSRAGRARTGELDTKECIDVVSQLADLDCELLTLSGGEPTLRPDWLEIAAAGIKKGLLVNVVSNGLTMSYDAARRVADTGLANVGVSLDGLPQTHEKIRGKDTFGKLEAAVRNLTRAGVPVSVMTTLNRFNQDELEDIHGLAVRMGASGWRVQLGKAMGNLADNRALVISPEALLNVVPRIAHIKKSSPIWVDVGDSIGYYGPFEKLLRKTRWPGMGDVWAGCQAGRRAIGIESDGGIKGCLSLQAGLKDSYGRDPFREGTVRERRLADIWFDPEAFSYNRRQTLDDLSGECRKCRYARRCRGGAKCVSAAAVGRLGEDPYCYHAVTAIAARRESRTGIAAKLSQKAAAAMVGLGLGLGGACLGGCMDRAIGPDDQHWETVDAGTVEQDAEPPIQVDYGVFPEYDGGAYDDDAEPPVYPEYGVMVPEDGGVSEGDAEPPSQVDYGVFPEYDAGAYDDDAEPPSQVDYGVFPEYDAGAYDDDAEPPVYPEYGDIPPN